MVDPARPACPNSRIPFQVGGKRTGLVVRGLADGLTQSEA